jgi:hypothetical protein
MYQIFNLANKRGKPLKHLFLKLISIKFLVHLRLLVPPFHEQPEYIVEASEVIMVCMGDKDLADPDCPLLFVHEGREVLEKQLVLLRIVP